MRSGLGHWRTLYIKCSRGSFFDPGEPKSPPASLQPKRWSILREIFCGGKRITGLNELSILCRDASARLRGFYIEAIVQRRVADADLSVTTDR